MSRIPVLSSSHNPRFRSALALRDSRERRARCLTLLDGVREIGQALAANVPVTEVWVARHRPHGERVEALVTAIAATGAPIVEATPELLARLAYGDRDEGIVAVVETPRARLDDLALPDVPLVGVLEGVEKPGNLGAVARTADGAGLDALIVADPVSDPWHPNAIRASLGTLFGLSLATCSAPEALEHLRAWGVRIVAARVDGSIDHDRADLTGSLAIVLGSEAEGLGDTWRGPHVTAVRIPMLGRADSLNVAASAAVLFYEARRQRRAAASGPGEAQVSRPPARRPG